MSTNDRWAGADSENLRFRDACERFCSVHSDSLFCAGAGFVATVGGPLAYARATVVELGGTLALVHDSDTTTFRIAPSIGYFPVDNLQFTLFPEFRITHVAETDTSFGLFLEPSYHLPASDVIFGFAGSSALESAGRTIRGSNSPTARGSASTS